MKRGTVHSIDIEDDEAVRGDGQDQHAAFEVPVNFLHCGRQGIFCIALRRVRGRGWRAVGLGLGRQHVLSNEGADAVDFPTETFGVVRVSWEGEVGCVETIQAGCVIVGVEGVVDDAPEVELRAVIRTGDFDFLEADYVRP